ncbi:MAG: TetR/AcrR family transcriptional regulator [Acidimicrobiales bacterium]
MSAPAAAGGSAVQDDPGRRAVGDRQKEARRLQILQAAKSVFAAAGFQTSTMADVAKAAGLSYGAVYWYFPSKEELFHALMEMEEESLRLRILEGLAGRSLEDPRQALSGAIRATFEFFEEDRAAVKLLFRDSYAMGGRFESHLTGIYERFIDDLAEVLAAAQRRGQVIAVPPRVAAFSVAALVGQLAYRRLTTDDGLEADVVADFVVGLVMDGLRPRISRARTEESS